MSELGFVGFEDCRILFFLHGKRRRSRKLSELGFVGFEDCRILFFLHGKRRRSRKGRGGKSYMKIFKINIVFRNLIS